MADLTFSIDELASSCYRAFGTALALNFEHWEHLGLDKQVPWLRLAQYGPARLESLEGFTYPQVARELWLLTLSERADEACAAWDLLPAAYRLAWQAAARHLMTLLDADDVDNVPALEQSWRQWLLGKLTPQEAVAV